MTLGGAGLSPWEGPSQGSHQGEDGGPERDTSPRAPPAVAHREGNGSLSIHFLGLSILQSGAPAGADVCAASFQPSITSCPLRGFLPPSFYVALL